MEREESRKFFRESNIWRLIGLLLFLGSAFFKKDWIIYNGPPCNAEGVHQVVNCLTVTYTTVCAVAGVILLIMPSIKAPLTEWIKKKRK